MRDYSKISGQFWTGSTGKGLRGDMQTQIVALYLMSSHHANMIGIYHLPILYIAHETGSPLEGATEGLRRLCEGGFCTYDEASEMVWVHEMAKFQIGDELKAGDNRIKDVQKQYARLPEGLIRQGFYEKYKTAFHLEKEKPLASPLEAPTKPEAGTGTEAGVNRFAEFWSAYPKKKAKAEARKAWDKAKINGEFDSLLTALELQKQTTDWKKNGGEFIPYPATWINGKRWEDEIPLGSQQGAMNPINGILAGVE